MHSSGVSTLLLPLKHSPSFEKKHHGTVNRMRELVHEAR